MVELNPVSSRGYLQFARGASGSGGHLFGDGGRGDRGLSMEADSGEPVESSKNVGAGNNAAERIVRRKNAGTAIAVEERAASWRHLFLSKDGAEINQLADPTVKTADGGDVGLGVLAFVCTWSGCGSRWRQQGASLLAPAARSGGSQTIMANFGKAFGQDMLEEPSQKLCLRQRQTLDLLGAVIAIAESDLAVFKAFQARVDDSDAKDVAPQVWEDFLPASGGLGVHDPLFVLAPDLGSDRCGQAGAAETISHFSAEDLRQGMNGHQELGIFRFEPLLSIGTQAAGAD